MELNSRGALFICEPLTNTYTSLIYDTLLSPLYDTLFDFFHGVRSEIQPLDRKGVFRKCCIEFLIRLAPSFNVNASQSRRESVHKVARQELEGSTHHLKIYISSVKDAYLNNEEIFDSLTLLSWYIHRFCKSLFRHIFLATKLIADTFSQKNT